MADEPEETFGARGSGWPLSARQTLAAVVAVVALVFILQNTDEVTVDAFTVTLTAPLWLVLGGLFVLGVLVGMLLQRRRSRS